MLLDAPVHYTDLFVHIFLPAEKLNFKIDILHSLAGVVGFSLFDDIRVEK